MMPPECAPSMLGDAIDRTCRWLRRAAREVTCHDPGALP